VTATDVSNIMAWARGGALVCCVAGMLIGAAAVVLKARSGLSHADAWNRIIAAAIGAVGVGASVTMLSIAYGH